MMLDIGHYDDIMGVLPAIVGLDGMLWDVHDGVCYVYGFNEESPLDHFRSGTHQPATS